MSRSPFIDEVILTPKHSGKRTEKVRAFVLHHMAAVWTARRCAEYLRDTPSRQASANYYIGHEGDVVLGVEEENRAWTSSSNWADQRALTYELANSKYGHPWEVSDATIQKAIVMLAEQHKRYGLKEASYTGDTKGTLWRHDWFANTNCPGPYLGGKFQYIADEINKILNGEVETHIVESGDTLWGISRQYDVTVDELKEWNGLEDDLIKPGQQLVLKKQPVIEPSSKPKPEPEPEPKPSTDIAGAKLVKNENAYFLATSNIKVRNNPTTKATHTGTLPEGASINYKRVFEGNGYRWLEYTGNSGNTLYLPYRRLSGDIKSWGTFHGDRPEPKPVEAGDRVALRMTAKNYATGEPIPTNRKGKTYTAQQVSNGKVLLKEILSWVWKNDVSNK